MPGWSELLSNLAIDQQHWNRTSHANPRAVTGLIHLLCYTWISVVVIGCLVKALVCSPDPLSLVVLLSWHD